jgi:hypothetical protein
MESKKNWWESKTIWGAVITVVCGGLALFGQNVDVETQSFLADKITLISLSVGQVVGAVIAIFGRFKAEKKIK